MPSRSSRDSSVVLRSASQKKRASRSRAVTTRSALRAIVRSLSGSVLMTARNAFFSLPVFGLDREVVLMMNQRRRQHFIGQLEELGAEGAGHDRRVLDEVGHLGEQAGLGAHHPADAPLEPLRLRVELAGNLVVPLAAFEHDEVLEQPRLVLVEGAHLDGAARASARREKPVAVGDRAGRDVLHRAALGARRARDPERHDAAAVGEEQPADRTAEQQLAPAVVEHRVPVHQLREREAAQRAAQHRRQHVHRRLAALLPAEREVVALGRLDALERATPRCRSWSRTRRPPASACRRL